MTDQNNSHNNDNDNLRLPRSFTVIDTCPPDNITMKAGPGVCCNACVSRCCTPARDILSRVMRTCLSPRARHCKGCCAVLCPVNCALVTPKREEDYDGKGWRHAQK